MVSGIIKGIGVLVVGWFAYQHFFDRKSTNGWKPMLKPVENESYSDYDELAQATFKGPVRVAFGISHDTTTGAPVTALAWANVNGVRIEGNTRVWDVELVSDNWSGVPTDILPPDAGAEFTLIDRHIMDAQIAPSAAAPSGTGGLWSDARVYG